jgi:pyruvate dehydrogenase E2 component (dihydrolipoamide acetyltransferase)
MSDTGLNGDQNYREEKAPLLRKVIARRMLESKTTIPHFYLTVDINPQNLIDLRKEFNANGTKKVSFNDIIIKAVAVDLKNHPECNVSYIDDMIRSYQTIDICLAVSVDGGLLTPKVTNCDKKSILEINEDTTLLIEKARNKRLRPREGMGGSFTISNLGMFDIEEFIAILNPPQPMILSVGSIREIPVVENGNIFIGKRMKMTLSSDHRALDGAMSAVFLTDLKNILENLREHV